MFRKLIDQDMEDSNTWSKIYECSKQLEVSIDLLHFMSMQCTVLGSHLPTRSHAFYRPIRQETHIDPLILIGVSYLEIRSDPLILNYYGSLSYLHHKSSLNLSGGRVLISLGNRHLLDLKWDLWHWGNMISFKS